VADALADTLPVDGDALREAVWARVQTARNLRRPHTLELLGMIATDVIELHGDRFFGDDPAIVAGFARIGDRPIVFIGHQKGAEVEENIRRNFGMPHPEGYRKAIRMFRLAERLRLPVVTFVDTPGASPDRLAADGVLEGDSVLPGYRLPVGELFGWLVYRLPGKSDAGADLA